MYQTSYDKMELYEACEQGDLDLVKSLVNQGANVKADANYALTVCCMNGHVELVKYLIEQGVNIHLTDDAFSWAIENGHLEVVKVLCSQPMDSYTYNERLQSAGDSHELEIVEYMLSHRSAILSDTSSREYTRSIARAVSRLPEPRVSNVECVEGSQHFNHLFENLTVISETEACRVCLTSDNSVHFQFRCKHSICTPCFNSWYKTQLSNNQANCYLCRQPL